MFTDELQGDLASLVGMLEALSHEELTTQTLLDNLTQFCVDHLGAAFARIWLVDDTGMTLVLKSSRGQYLGLNGTRSRIAIGQGSKIDKMITEGAPHITNAVLEDPGVKDKEWAKREGFISFAGYPLIWGGEKLGVVGMYSRQTLSEELLLVMGVFVHMASAIVYQMNHTRRNMAKFCEVTGFRPSLLDQLIKLGRNKPTQIAA